jgi:quinol monooxygenase YgiN
MTGKGQVVRIVAQSGRRDELLAILEPMSAQVAREPGTVMYLVHVSTDHPDEVWVYGRFTDEAAFAAHRDSDTHVAVVAGLRSGICAPGTQSRFVDVVSAKGLPDAQ